MRLRGEKKSLQDKISEAAAVDCLLDCECVSSLFSNGMYRQIYDPGPFINCSVDHCVEVFKYLCRRKY